MEYIIVIFIPDEVRILSQLSDTIVSLLDRQIFTCNATGIPIPNIVWTKDGSVLDPVIANITMTTIGTTITSQLDLEELMLSDEGRYSCNASNTIGSSDVQDFTLTLESKEARFKLLCYCFIFISFRFF